MTPVSSLTNGSAVGQRVRLEGTVEASLGGGNFFLRLMDGRVLKGQLVGRSFAGLARVFGRSLVIFGTGRSSATGEVEMVEADGFIPNDGQPWIVSPDDLPLSEEVAQEMANRQQSIRGAWPGDETDAQVEKALQDLS